MEENNKQDPKFKELSTKKKVIHYVGWPLFALSCAGTIAFGVLWSSNNKESIISIEHTSDEWVDISSINPNFSKAFSHAITDITANKKYRVSFSPSSIPEEHDVSELANIYLFIYNDELDPESGGIGAPIFNWDSKVYVDSNKVDNFNTNFSVYPDMAKGTNISFYVSAWKIMSESNITDDSIISFEFSFEKSEDKCSHIYTAVVFN